ncbi:MAG: hypothetical protein JRH07_17035 [Deltaproteobacteria bacterium]|nr:hypothetical protein [Deltaproteobacteria bacterium]MBW2123527.1 hypothetical protein [Deltaproteobacteria bacterium]
MDKAKIVRWSIVGVSAAVVLVVSLWIWIARERSEQPRAGKTEPRVAPRFFEKKSLEGMDTNQLRAYILACEKAGDLQACEEAYKRAIRLTRGQKSRFQEFIDFQFGLADLYLNSLWEYGQFGGGEEIPPALTRALKIYDEIIASYPGSELAAEAQFRKGEVFHNEFSGYWNNLHRKDAIREFQKVIEHYPDTDQAQKATHRLAALLEEE